MKNSIAKNLSNELIKIQIVKHAKSNIAADLEDYAKNKKTTNSSLNFNDYIKEKYYQNDPNKIIVADLSNQDLIGNFEGVDLTGSILKGATFRHSNLKGAIFCDADLQDACFYSSSLTETDFRGAELSGVFFDSYYQEAILSKNIKDKEMLRGIKFSTNNNLLRHYLISNQMIDEKIQEEKKIFENNKSRDIKLIKDEMSEVSSFWNYIIPNMPVEREYAELEEELKKTESKNFTEKPHYLINPSLINIMGASGESLFYDPAYIRGSSTQERNQKREYVKLTKEDIIEYLKLSKLEIDLTLNEYAKRKAQTSTAIDHEAKFIADCTKLDLSGLEFNALNISESCFAACKLNDCKFINCNISKSSFEGSNLDGSIFNNVIANDSNCFNISMQKTKIIDSNFERAYISHSVANQDTTIENSKFNYTKAKYSKWNGIAIKDTELHNANLEGISLIGAHLRGVQAQNIILNNAILKSSEVIKSDLTNALMINLQAQEVKFKEETILQGIHASYANLTDSEIERLVNLDEANLNDAIMEHVKADNVNFTKIYLERANLRRAQLKDAILEETHMAFADLSGAIIDGAKAAGVDLSNAKMQDIQAVKVDFEKALMENIDAQKGNFEASIMQESKLRGANLSEAILNKVNLRKTELENAKLKSAKVEDANFEGATVNSNSNMSNIKGKVQNGNLAGKTTVAAQKQHSEAIEREEKSTFISKLTNKLLGSLAAGTKKVKEYTKEPLSARTSMIIGAVACTAVMGIFLTSAILTAGLSVAFAAGSAIAAGGFGAGAGYYVAKQGGACAIMAGLVGTVYGGAVGLGVSLSGYFALDTVVRQQSGGKGINDLTIDGLTSLENTLNNLKEKFADGGTLGEKELANAKHLEKEQNSFREKTINASAHRQFEERNKNQTLLEDRELQNNFKTAKNPQKEKLDHLKQNQTTLSFTEKYAPNGNRKEQSFVKLTGKSNNQEHQLFTERAQQAKETQELFTNKSK